MSAARLSETLLAHGDAPDAVPVRFVTPDTLDAELAGLSEAQRAYVAATGFKPRAGRIALVPDPDGRLACVLFGLGKADAAQRTPFLPGKLADLLPAGTYRFANQPDDPAMAALAFALGRYRFTAYRAEEEAKELRLVVPEGADLDDLRRIADGVALARDLVNTPANDMGPAELEAAARAVVEAHGAELTVTTGPDLIEANLPLIHVVGRASARPPRLIDLTWGAADAPKVTIAGKGVCFDTGGLDIKNAAGMLLMKKDMGGAAAALGLASMVMAAGLPIRLRVLIPAVENAISADAFRPGDVIRSRKGLAIGIGNTDAEGRLVLADALALADEETPELVIDLATLTGAARVALGPELPALYSDDDGLAGALLKAGDAVDDPLWRMPLWRPYARYIDSKIADIDNAGSGGMAGSITAALFLSRFVERAAAWAHLDVFAWNPANRPGRPEGGEGQAIRAIYEMLKARYR